MAERRARRAAFQVYCDYTFDRFRESKLAQAYDIVVPGRERLIGARAKEGTHEDGGNIRTSIVGAAARETHNREPNGGIDRVREDPRVGSPQGVGFRRRRL